ncbi:hypothetical protein [Acanthopleuribacter pedis]|uniref:DUF3857 domain-containing protein n=1 Tax=Acanthopleuribacter pedis TaxID=442870 RepID=A0A8J7QJY0_9BACT|nr:hypothetical protein [Acanthopleuribacter pedis]MBO1319613.1 hypothetical protein [Acanthopleuribacter pedis]
MNLYRTATLLLLGLMFLQCSQSKRVTYLPGETGSGATAQSPTAAELTQQYGEVPGVMLNYERTLEHVITSGFLPHAAKWRYFELHRRNYLVLDPKDATLGTFSFNLERGDTFKVANLFVRQPDGQTKTFTADDFQAKVHADGSTTYKFAYPGLIQGTVIDEQIEVFRANPFKNPPLYHDVPLQFAIPCKRVIFSYAYPDWWKIKVKEVAENQRLDFKVQHNSAGNKRILRYEQTDVPAVIEEPMSPWFKEKALYAELMVTELKVGDTFYKAPRHWEAMGNDLRAGVHRNRATFSSRVARVALKVTKGLDDPAAKLDAIVTYVQEQVDPTGGDVGNFAKILAEKRGNPFMNTALTMEMLRHVGINSEFLMIHSAADGHFDTNFISSGQFTFPALRVKLERKLYFVLPYIQGMPIDHLPQPLQGQHALIADQSGRARIVKIPEGNLAENGEQESLDLVLREDGVVEVAERKVLRGSRAVSARAELGDLSEEERETRLRDWITFNDGAPTQVEVKVVDLADHKKPLQIKLTYQIDNALVVTPEEVLFRPSGLFRALRELSVKTDVAERRSDVVVPYDLMMEKTVSLTYPEHWRLVEPPQAVSLSNQFGEVKAAVDAAPGSFSMARRISLNKTRQDKRSFGALLELAGAGRADLATLVFEKGTAP